MATVDDGNSHSPLNIRKTFPRETRTGKRENTTIVKKIALVVKADKRARSKAGELERWFTDRGVHVFRKDNLPSKGEFHPLEQISAPDDLTCVFVLGGDGTFLSAVRWIGEHPIPVLGVKFGEVGFLAEISEDNLFAVAETLLNEGFDTTPRMRLRVRVMRGEKQLADETVLNDVVINRGALARLAYVDTFIDDQYLTTYVADGLIIATPTGSTAYSLAAGGPIIHPQVPGIMMTPICPFTLTNRPLIVPESACIRLRLAKDATDIMLTFDGQAGFEINEADEIIVQKADNPVHLISMPGQDYFELVKAKLRWSGGRA